MYCISAIPTCRVFERHGVLRACARARAKTGNRIAARMAMIAITTSNSIRVKPRSDLYIKCLPFLRCGGCPEHPDTNSITPQCPQDRPQKQETVALPEN